MLSSKHPPTELIVVSILKAVYDKLLIFGRAEDHEIIFQSILARTSNSITLGTLDIYWGSIYLKAHPALGKHRTRMAKKVHLFQ